MKKQAGVSLIGMLIIASLAAFILLLAFRSVPAWSEFFAVQKILNAITQQATKESTVAQLRRSFEDRADIDYVENVKPQDVIVTKEGNEIVLTVDYERRVPVVGNVYLVFVFHASSRGGRAVD